MMKSIHEYKYYIVNMLCIWISLLSPVLAQKAIPLTIHEDKQGIEIFENNLPVIYYRLEPKSPDGINFYNNYIHPLYAADGDTLTEEFPADHPYHRGVFWAWHQVFINNQSIGDGWVMHNIKLNLTGVKTLQKDSMVVIESEWNWTSPFWESGKPFIKEHTSIQVYSWRNCVRIIDFEIILTALCNNVSIGGSNDEKGYGGFCIRMKLPADLAFTSLNGPVIPQTLQIDAGPWMDFSGSFGRKDMTSGVTLLCHPGNNNYPEPWILRKATSMQNIVFPGRTRTLLRPLNPLKLKYRLLVHKGNVKDFDILKYQRAYEDTHF